VNGYPKKLYVMSDEIETISYYILISPITLNLELWTINSKLFTITNTIILTTPTAYCLLPAATNNWYFQNKRGSVTSAVNKNLPSMCFGDFFYKR
jgi:hypothetical protein